MGLAAPMRTERKQHQERLHGSKLAQQAPRVSSITPHFKIATRLRLMVPLCAHETPLRLRTNICWRNVRHVHGTTGTPRFLVQPGADVMEARRHRRDMANHLPRCWPLSSPQTKSCSVPSL